jgi:hypothetical protein
MSNILEPNEIEKLYTLYIEHKFGGKLSINQPDQANVLNYLKKIA